MTTSASLSGILIWVELGSINSSREFLTTPKVAASVVECPSVTAKLDLETVEVAGSSPVVPTISLIFPSTTKTLLENLGPLGSNKVPAVSLPFPLLYIENNALYAICCVLSCWNEGVRIRFLPRSPYIVQQSKTFAGSVACTCAEARMSTLALYSAYVFGSSRA
jgi:hypothetical protein